MVSDVTGRDGVPPRIAADLVAGRDPGLDLAPYRPGRRARTVSPNGEPER